ncbi:MAG: polyamine aminopropyltransferase [Desulfarculaceae bacterium]|nr:polyamine aminopropyltransferase [Desulfarculaceae bacterium]MCF8074123.1 polyamine aminopropyltransferase [Desulfarculaceae bacterium]MCF8103285.1 polyamine aminopropyltransferase [Desulfarculaceae bacterium]MCF8116857.1 polyamine aminopropyltransferase [Desulfarculaceae bacterium]
MPQHPQARKQPRDGKVFLEQPDLGGALGVALKVDEVLHHARTKHQELHVVSAGRLGRVLLLDGIIQTTEYDEPGYHEMLAHVPMLVHPAPSKVLIIGGGDGGTLREVLKHPTVREVLVCEIDGEVVEAAKRFLPGLASGFDDPRVQLIIGDGVAYVADSPGGFDTILIDSSDPEGPAEGLFGESFYQSVRAALGPGGVAAALAESYHLYQDLIRGTFAVLERVFAQACYYTAQVPTYNSGIIGFALMTTGAYPLSPPDPMRIGELEPLRYYTEAAHRAAFALPRPALELLPPRIAEMQENIFASARGGLGSLAGL